MIDNHEIDEILNILEDLEDEVLSAKLLKEFNDCSARLGKLILNTDKKLSHKEWKNLCDQAQKNLNDVVKEIQSKS